MNMLKKLESEGDSYNAIMLKLVCDRLAEALQKNFMKILEKIIGDMQRMKIYQ